MARSLKASQSVACGRARVLIQWPPVEDLEPGSYGLGGECAWFGQTKTDRCLDAQQAIAEATREYWPQAAPEFRFHRGDSWENTIAYGKEHCEFIFESK
jgi:hypothetical protein